MRISEKEFRELLDRYLNNTATPEERAIVDRFFESYQPGLLEGDNENASSQQDEILRDVHARIRSNTRKRKNRLVMLWLPLAAVFSLFVLAYFLTDFRRADTRKTACAAIEIKTIAGQRSVARLPDGTTVHLNGDSRISYCGKFGENIREVKLWGEAYFDVVNNAKRFVVQTDGMRTEVMGTSFNVKSRGGERAEVTLVEGKVNVISAAHASLLSPNQLAVIDLKSGAIATMEVNVLAYTSWKDNTLFFEQTSLKEAVAILESWYAVRIDMLNPALAQCTITAKYQDEPLGNVLGSLQFLLTLDIIRLNETHYTINGTGCKRK